MSSWATAGLVAQSGLAEAKKGLADADAQVRIAAVQALGKLGTTPAAQALFGALADGDEGVRKAAAVAFGAIGKKAIPVLSAALAADDVDRQMQALAAIGKLGADAAPLLPRATKLWLVDTMALTNAVEQCMVDLGKHALPELIRCVDVFGVQGRACHALGTIGPDAKSAVPALCKLMLSKTASRSDAANALIGIRDPASVPDLAKVLLEEAKSPGTTGAAANAATALAEIGPEAKAGVPALLTLLGVTGGDQMQLLDRERCIMALDRIGDRSDRVRSVLLHIAKSESGTLQIAAKQCLALFELADDAPDDLILHAVSHPNADIVALGLQRAATRRSVTPDLADAIAHRVNRAPDRSLRLVAIRALVAVGGRTKEALGELEKAAADADAEIAAAARAAREELVK